MRTDMEKLLYRCVRELEFVQEAGYACTSGLCATSEGKKLVDDGMKMLGVTDLEKEDLQ